MSHTKALVVVCRRLSGPARGLLVGECMAEDCRHPIVLTRLPRTGRELGIDPSVPVNLYCDRCFVDYLRGYEVVSREDLDGCVTYRYQDDWDREMRVLVMDANASVMLQGRPEQIRDTLRKRA
jgi:hypothetical protein